MDRKDSDGAAKAIGFGVVATFLLAILAAPAGAFYGGSYKTSPNKVTGALDVSGTTTAAAFSGPLTGNVTGNATGLSGSPNITVGTIASGAINSQTISSAASFTGTVNATTGYKVNAAAAAGTLLRGNGTNYVASTATIPDTCAVSRVVYASATDTLACLATANSGLLNTDSGGIPSITAAPTISGIFTTTSTAGNSINTAGGVAASKTFISGSTSATTNMNFRATGTGTAAANLYGFYDDATHTLSTNGSEVEGFDSLHAVDTTASNFTLGADYGFRYRATAKSGTGAVTNGYGFFGVRPTIGTNNYTFYGDDYTLSEVSTAPSTVADGAAARVYMKADLFVIAYNHGGTMKYRYLTLTSTDATWTYSTVAP